jgi:predicted MFS family arabinose efflux permease
LISGGILTGRIASPSSPAAPIAIFFAGTGGGIILSGAGIPLLLDHAPGRWPIGWLALAGAAGLAVLGSWGAARPDPAQPDTAPPAAGIRLPRRWWRVACAYTMFGAGYIAYPTFLSAYLAARHAGIASVVATWILLGASALLAPRLWSRPIATWRDGRAMAALLAILAAASALALPHLDWTAQAASAVIFGACFMMVPSAVTAMVCDGAPAGDATSLLAAMTVVFAIGQTAGPWLSGLIADHTTSSAVLTWCAALCAIAAVLMLPQSGESARASRTQAESVAHPQDGGEPAESVSEHSR